MRFALVTKVLVLEMNTLKVLVQISVQHSYTCNYMYQRFSRRTSLENVTHRHSPSKTGNSHGLILTCE